MGRDLRRGPHEVLVLPFISAGKRTIQLIALALAVAAPVSVIVQSVSTTLRHAQQPDRHHAA